MKYINIYTIRYVQNLHFIDALNYCNFTRIEVINPKNA